MPDPQRLSPLVHDLIGRRAGGPDGASPLLVHRDETAGTRVELSGVSLANTVAKASALFEEEAGGSVALAIPSHWIGAALALAAWHAGLVVRLEGAAEGDGDLPATDVLVVGPDVPAEARAQTTYVSRLHPFALPFDADVALPGNVEDLAPALRSGPDRLGPPADFDAADVVLTQDAAEYRTADVLDAAQRLAAELGQGVTLLSTLSMHDLRGLLAVTLLPLLTGGSTVLVTGSLDPEQVSRVAAVERASVTWDSPR